MHAFNIVSKMLSAYNQHSFKKHILQNECERSGTVLNRRFFCNKVSHKWCHWLKAKATEINDLFIFVEPGENKNLVRSDAFELKFAIN